MSDNFKKFLIALSAVCFLSLLIFIVYKQIEIADKQKEIESSMIKQKDIGDSITRSMSQYATSKDLEMLIRGNGMDLSKISDDLTKLKSKIDSINVISSSSTGYDWHDIPSSGSINLPAPHGDPVSSAPVVDCGDKKITCLQDPNHYWTTTQLLDVHEEFKDIKVPFARVGFTASKDKPWGVSTYDRQYKVVTVTGTDEDGRVSNYNKMQIIAAGKTYDVPIAQAETSQQYPDAKFRWFSPRLYVGVDGGVTSHGEPDLSPTLQMAFMNYGRYVATPDVAVLQVGVGVNTMDKKGYISITPASYNIGKHLPFIKNTYLGLSVNAAVDGTVAVTGGIKVGL
jgi:hypothetical protein